MFKLQKKQSPNPQSTQLLKSSIHQNQTILYLRTFDNNNKIITICLSAANKLIIRQCSIDKKYQFQYSRQGFQQSDLVNIRYAFIESDDVFIVLARQTGLTIYYGPKGEVKFIRLILNDQIQFQRCLIDLNYPNLIIFGDRKQVQKLQIIQLNLDTLSIKTINQGKGYSPGYRTQYLPVIADGRLYIFGGKDKNNKLCNKLIWVYDLQKGYWFALQMEYDDKQNYGQFQTNAISSSRVLVMDKTNNRGWILEIHQSRLTEVQNFMQLKNRNVCLKGQLVNYSDKGWNLWEKQIVYNKKI